MDYGHHIFFGEGSWLVSGHGRPVLVRPDKVSANKMKQIVWYSLAFLANVLRIALVIFVFLLVVVFISEHTYRPEQYGTLMKVSRFGQQFSEPLLEQLKLAVPYRFAGTDYSSLMLGVLALILMHFLLNTRERCLAKARQIKARTDYYKWRSQVKDKVSKEKMSEMDSTFEALNTTKSSDRKKMLKEFAALKGKLDNMGQQLAFLAIDVVDSTGMKRDEDKHIAAYDFDRYNELVDTCLKQGGAIKYAKTPDGIMSCFRTVDAAVSAATSLFDKLSEFNKHEKQIKRSFQIRCGINAGFVYVDDETPLEQVSDRVIDIAGHMQKFAKPDCINIAATAIEPLKHRSGFSETTDVIDEQKVYEWRQDKP